MKISAIIPHLTNQATLLRTLESVCRAAVFFLGFFALYALTAQRGLGWGDSGEFQHWILHGIDSGKTEGFSNLHPLYLAFARFVAHTPFAVTLVSSFFGAVAVAGFFLCSRNAALTVLFGLSHMLWWMSCVAEVQTMSLAFTAFETFALLRWLETEKGGWFVLTALLAGLHLNGHNFALLALPVYFLLPFARRVGWRCALASLVAFAAGAAYWLYALVTRGVADVLVGRYGAKVFGHWPSDGRVTAFNLALAALSLVVPAALAWWNRRGGETSVRRVVLVALFSFNFLFFIRYFVPDQAMFVLPTLFFAYLLVADAPLRPARVVALAAMQIVLPVAAYLFLSRLPPDAVRAARHPYRDDAAYFALPWKCHDDSADRCAAEQPGPWAGYYRPAPSTKH